MSTIRFKFSREEELRFISHLDQQRLFQRAFRRAKLHIAHSNGFNPHPRLSFALAMSVGLISDSEYGEVVLSQSIDLMDFTKRLNHVLPKGLKILEVWEVPKGTDSLSASLTDSCYEIECAIEKGLTQDRIDAILVAYLEKDEVILEKRNKKGKFLSKNIRPFVQSIEMLSFSEETSEACLKLQLQYIDQQSVKPELVFQTVNDTIESCFIINPTIGIARKVLNLKK